MIVCNMQAPQLTKRLHVF